MFAAVAQAVDGCAARETPDHAPDRHMMGRRLDVTARYRGAGVAQTVDYDTATVTPAGSDHRR